MPNSGTPEFGGDLLSGDGRTYVWSAFGKPVRIVKGSNQVDLAYGPDRARFKRIDTTATDQTVTHYVGGKLYEAIDRAGVAEQKHYLGGFAVVTHYVATGVIDHAYYLTDHLGSIDTVTDQSGAVIERMSFDMPSTTSMWSRTSPSSSMPSATDPRARSLMRCHSLYHKP